MIVLCADFLLIKLSFMALSFRHIFGLGGRGTTARSSGEPLPDRAAMGAQSRCSLPHAATIWTCSCQAEKSERDRMQVLTGDCISGLLFERFGGRKEAMRESPLEGVNLGHNTSG